MLLEQQLCVINLAGLTNRLETHKPISDDPVEQVHNNHGSTLI